MFRRFRRIRRRRKKELTQRPFDEAQLPKKSFLTIAESVEEGLLLTEYASRMAVKNRFITKILADKQPWFIEHSQQDARATLQLLARESDDEAEHLATLIQKFRDNPRSEKDSQGYSYNDIHNMEHRKAVALAIAQRLREQSDDEQYLHDIVDTARRDAWQEISANIEHNLDVEYFPIDEEYERNRDDRLRAFIDEDLATLLAGTTTEQGRTTRTKNSDAEIETTAP